MRLQLHIGVAKKSLDLIPFEFSAQGDHSEGFAHGGADKLLGLRIENDVVERLRITVEDRGHHTVTGRGDGIPENRLGFLGGAPQETC